MTNFITKIKEYLQRKAVRNRIRKLISVISCIVVFATTYALLLPALTLEAETLCGMEEHQHTEQCYEKVLVCGLEETDGHQHTETCFDEEGNLLCGLEESEGHHHDDSCYESVLACGKETHIHTADCYKKPEPEPDEEEQSEQNIEEQSEQDLQEDPQEEASMEQDPQSNDTAELPSVSENTVDTVEIVAPVQKDQIRFAKFISEYSGIYYLPEDARDDEWKPADSALRDFLKYDDEEILLDPEEQVLIHIAYELPAGTINTTNAETEYTLPLLLEMTSEEVRENNNYRNYIYAGNDRDDDNLKDAGTYEIKEKYNSQGEVTERKLVIRWNEETCRRNGGESLTDGTVTVQPAKEEGFLELRISAKELLQLEEAENDGDARVLYWGKETEKRSDLSTTVKIAAEQEEEKASPESSVVSYAITADGETYKITVSYDAESGIPSDASLDVKEIVEDSEEYAAYMAEVEAALQAGRKVRMAKLFDITILDGEGNKVEPLTPVRVNIEFVPEDVPEGTNIELFHFQAEGETPKAMENVEVHTDEANTVNGVEFETDGFSVYGVVYTVDFHWEVDGKMYELNVPGGGFVSFRKLIEMLGIVSVENSGESDIARYFVEDVESVEFSTPELLSVSKVEEKTTVGAIKDALGLECEYSADLTDEQIREINAQAVEAGDWALISVQPFDSDEILTVVMKNGDSFEIRVTDAAYQGTIVTDPNGKTVALINVARNNALQSTAHSTYGRLQANDLQINGNRITTVDPLSTWTFTRVPNTTDQYYIQASNGYLNITNGNLFVTNQQQALLVQQKTDGTIRIRPTNTNTAVNLVGSITSNGYGTYGSDWDANPDEWFTMYEIGEPIVPHVTVHYVDRYGNELTDVAYTGNNPLVVRNADGTFTIPYDWGSGQTTDTSVDLRAEFNKEGWTYANTHLAGVDADGTSLTHDGYVIDSVLTRSGSNLQFKSDSGSTWGFNPAGNLKYGELSSFSLSSIIQVTPSVRGNRMPYALSSNKDIYVVLDPPAQYSPGGGPDGGGLDIEDPTFTKEMEPNDDGTYTLSLEVNAHAKNASETKKANVLFIVDTSSSMRAVTDSSTRNRIMDTQAAVKEFGDKLLAYNEEHPDAVEVAMLTFDGGVDERLDWTSDRGQFDTSVNDYLRYYYLHTGTDWEDGLKTGLDKILTETDDDPTFLVFFTDGEPSQYSNFHGPGTNGNPDPTGTHTGGTDPGSGYPDFFSYFLSREASKDEMRAIVNTGTRLYGIYAYNRTDEHYDSYNGEEDGAKMLHNAIRYGYDTTADLTGNKFFEAHNTNDVLKAFDEIFNSITETVGLSNLVVRDGIAAGVTSTAVVDGDVSAFTYIIKNKSGNLEYKVTVAPNGAPAGTEDGLPVFRFSDNVPHVGEITSVETTKVKTNPDGIPVTDPDGKIQTETVNVNVYYYKDNDTNKEYIMPIATTGANVAWDLSPLGLLQDGYTYEVNFVVWPNQESYDLVADLNNGKRTDLEEHWEDMPVLYDKDGRAYRKGGITEYPFISRYDPTDDTPAIYSAMSNTEQTMDYYVVDRKSEGGEEVEVITGPFSDPIDPPDPMPLTSALSMLEKKWNVDRDPNVLYQLLFGGEEPLTISFDITQDGKTPAYKTVELGWKSNNNPDDVWDGEYIWEPDTELEIIEFNGKTYQVGRYWASDFAIATGLMLSEERMDELGLNKGSYPHGVFNETTYYILEEGHDYSISEPELSYDFDFTAPTYHPMLVDGVLQSVNFTIDEGTGAVEITAMTDNETGLSALKIENTLRGYIHLDKVVVDLDGETVMESDKTEFEYTVVLDNPNAPFDGDHIPWYGINSLFYHDEEGNYYQAQVRDGQLQLTTETGGPYPATCVGFNPDEVGPQTITYTDDSGTSQTVVIYGNQMTMSNEQKTVTATIHITQEQTLNIANVPIYSTYTITEGSQEGYELIKIKKEIRKNESDEDPEKTEIIDDISDRSVSGEIIPNRDNHLVFYNKAQRGGLVIQKHVLYNGLEDEERQTVKEHLTGTYTFTIYTNKECTVPYMENGLPKTVSLTIDGTLAAVTSEEVVDMPAGDYWIKEDTEGHDALPLENPVKVTVKARETGTGAVVAEFKNNYEAVPAPLEIIKVKAGTEVRLPGAVFSITRLDETTGRTKYKPKEGSETEVEPYYTEERETDADGKILFEELNPGIYEIKETAPPAGYVLVSDTTFYIRVDDGVVHWVDKVENDGVVTWNEKPEGKDGNITFIAAKEGDPDSGEGASNASFTVENTPGASLPDAGGPGTGLFTIIGGLLITFAVLVMKRRGLLL